MVRALVVEDEPKMTALVRRGLAERPTVLQAGSLRLDLLEHAWDYAYENRSNVVDVYVGYLRAKIDRPFGRQSIDTVRGAGYRLRGDGGR
jgi:hypothetical protein